MKLEMPKKREWWLAVCILMLFLSGLANSITGDYKEAYNMALFLGCLYVWQVQNRHISLLTTMSDRYMELMDSLIPARADNSRPVPEGTIEYQFPPEATEPQEV